MHNNEDAEKKIRRTPTIFREFGLFHDVLCETGNNFIRSLDGSSAKVSFPYRLCKEL